jgi:hypothetical protein
MYQVLSMHHQFGFNLVVTCGIWYTCVRTQREGLAPKKTKQSEKYRGYARGHYHTTDWLETASLGPDSHSYVVSGWSARATGRASVLYS